MLEQLDFRNLSNQGYVDQMLVNLLLIRADSRNLCGTDLNKSAN